MGLKWHQNSAHGALGQTLTAVGGTGWGLQQRLACSRLAWETGLGQEIGLIGR